MKNLPLPSDTNAGNNFIITKIKTVPIITESDYIPFCPWPNIKFDTDLYLKSVNASFVTFTSQLFIHDDDHDILEFNHQSYNGPKIDILLCKDYIMSEFDIILGKKELHDVEYDSRLPYLIKNIITNKLYIDYGITFDMFVENKNISIVLYSKLKRDDAELHKLYTTKMDYIKKTIDTFISLLISNI